MRVLIVLREFYCSSLPMGGAERQSLKLAVELSRIGIRATILTGLWEWGQPHREVIQGIRVDRHFSAWGMFNIKGLRKFAYYSYLLSLLWHLFKHRNEYEIIHCHSARVESSIGVMVGHWLNKPTLIRPMASGKYGDIHKLYGIRMSWIRDKIAGQLRLADAVVVLNPQITEELVRIGVPRGRIVHIPNGVEIHPSFHQRCYAARKPITFAFVGRLHPQKGVTTLLRAFCRLAKETPDLPWRLRLAGTGPLEHELKAMAKDHGVDRDVEFLGFIECVPALLEACDVFVLPSLSEGLSNALLEAMSLGLPCIATDIPGNNDLIQHQRNGWLVPPNDEKALADAILELSLNEAIRSELGQEAMKTIQGSYYIGCVARQYASLYAEMLKCKPRKENHIDFRAQDTT